MAMAYEQKDIYEQLANAMRLHGFGTVSHMEPDEAAKLASLLLSPQLDVFLGYLRDQAEGMMELALDVKVESQGRYVGCANALVSLRKALERAREVLKG